MNDRKRGGLGRGLEVLLADTQPFEATQTAPTNAAEPSAAKQATPIPDETLHNERLELLKEAEALRILMLEFELIVRTDLH